MIDLQNINLTRKEILVSISSIGSDPVKIPDPGSRKPPGSSIPELIQSLQTGIGTQALY